MVYCLSGCFPHNCLFTQKSSRNFLWIMTALGLITGLGCLVYVAGLSAVISKYNDTGASGTQDAIAILLLGPAVAMVSHLLMAAACAHCIFKGIKPTLFAYMTTMFSMVMSFFSLWPMYILIAYITNDAVWEVILEDYGAWLFFSWLGIIGGAAIFVVAPFAMPVFRKASIDKDAECSVCTQADGWNEGCGCDPEACCSSKHEVEPICCGPCAGLGAGGVKA